MLNKKWIFSALVVAGLAGSAAADQLEVGGSLSSSQYTLGGPPGVLLVSTEFDWNQTFPPGTNEFFGTMVSSVYEIIDPSTSERTGLVFAYKVTVNSAPDHGLENFSVTGPWGSYDISDAGADSNGTGNGGNGNPNRLEHPSFSALSAEWDGFIAGGGKSSATFWFQTDALRYQTGFAAYQNGHNGGGQADVVAPIPLPSAGLMGLAGMGLVAVRRRR